MRMYVIDANFEYIRRSQLQKEENDHCAKEANGEYMYV